MASTRTKSTCSGSASASASASTCTGTCTSSTDIESSVTSSCTSCYNDEADYLRMVVSNNSRFVNNPSSSSTFKGMVMYYDKRPSHFPPAIDNILWAGLSTRVQEVVDSQHIFSSFDSFHRKMEAVVKDAAPHFQKVGYNITYETMDSYFRHLAWIRFIPYTNEESSGHRQQQQQQQQQQQFRVAVYGGRAGEPRFIKGRHYRNRPKEVETFVDELTWAVVATEMRPLIDFDHCKGRGNRKGILVMLVSFIMLSLVAFLAIAPSNQPLQIIVFSLSIPFVSAFFGSCAAVSVPAPIFTNVLQQMKEKINKLSPLVEEFTGYTLYFSVECAGVYVGFKPRNSISRASPPTDDHHDPADLAEPTLLPHHHDSLDFPRSTIEGRLNIF